MALFRKSWQKEFAEAIETSRFILSEKDIKDIDFSHFEKSKRPLVQVMDFSRNAFTVVPSLHKFSNLTDVNFSFNKIASFPDKQFCSTLPQLKSIKLAHNLIQSFPEHVTCLTNLEFIGISDNKLDAAPEILLQLPQLKQILISGNYIDIASNKCSLGLFEKMAGANDMLIPSKIMDGLYLGSYEAAKYKAGLQERKVTHILTVGHGLKPEFSESEFKYKIVKLMDIETENLSHLFDELFAFIEEGRNQGGVLVHCAAGVSRSAATVIGYVMKTLRLGYKDAFVHVWKSRPVVFPNSGFVKQLKELEESLGLTPKDPQ